ncbi:MAG: bifunctional diguanylate cyclase/phosphodiesterase [bacterium]|nr:bifunctional diguanylate cyclase/phosphodiesterase [bacterium]
MMVDPQPADDPSIRRLLFLHEDPEFAGRVGELLSSPRAGAWRVAHHTHLKDALVHLQVGAVDLVLVGPGPADTDQITALRRFSATGPDLPIVALVKGSGGRVCREALSAGAHECLDTDDFDPAHWGRALGYTHREVHVNRELAVLSARLDWLTHQDGLTGLLNRKGLERVMMDELARCRRDERDLMMVLLDLDDFAGVNATLGHGVGDLVLVNAARRTLESLQEGDHAGRCGTDRFVVFLPGADREQAETVAEQIRLSMGRDAIKAGAHTITATASLAVVAVAPDSLCFDEVLARAHYALQRGKAGGGNRVIRGAGPREVEQLESMETGPDTVRDLLRGDVLSVVAQPIVNLRDGRIVSHEMLVRGPRGPLRRPDDLFRFCQEQDILQALDLRCLKLCVGTARRGGLDRFHVNIMPATLLQTPTPELVRVLRGANGGRGHCCLEISEQQLLSDPSVLVGPVRELQAAGLQIAVDDVGFGNSCLEGLIMLQPQIMKIDKRMVAGLDTDADRRRSLNRLLLVAEALGAKVVAEGVETAAEQEVLLELGVRLGQGYFFGRPMPLDSPADATARVRPPKPGRDAASTA